MQILHSWQHRDVTLEDCGFDIRIEQVSASVTFHDDQDWIDLFHRIDGVWYHMDNADVFISRNHLVHAGLDIDGLTDVLQNLKRVLSICENAHGPEFEQFNRDGNDYKTLKYWVRIGKPRMQ